MRLLFVVLLASMMTLPADARDKRGGSNALKDAADDVKAFRDAPNTPVAPTQTAQPPQTAQSDAPGKKFDSAVDSAYFLCHMFDASKLLSQKCAVNYKMFRDSWIDISINMTANDAQAFCGQLPRLISGWGVKLKFDPGWQLRISTPYSTRPVASCDLDGV